ncbi:flavodoxin family protein, partial [bacterium]|nr:flavodoxin family protein [bacterium]
MWRFLPIILACLLSLAGEWYILEGDFNVEKDRLLSDGKSNSIVIPSQSPFYSEGEFRAILRVQSRTVSGGWALSGIMVYLSPSHYWQLTLVEGPNGERYGELAEMCNGVWRAEIENNLPVVKRSEKTSAWEYGKDYLLHLTFNPKGISGEIKDNSTGETIYEIAFSYPPGVQVVKGGKMALRAMGLSSIFSTISWQGTPMGLSGRRGNKIGIFISYEPGYPRSLAEKIASTLKAKGKEVELIDEETIKGSVLNRDNYSILILPDASYYPISAKGKLLSFLEAGGNLFCLGGAIFTNSVRLEQERWERLQEEIAKTPAERTIIDFKNEDLSKWTRASNDLASVANFNPVPEGPKEGVYSLKFEVANLTGWDTLLSPPIAEPFPDKQNLTCFWAKGDKNTGAMLVEWREKDGSRWIATVPLSTSWQYYALTPEKFAYWPDNPSKGRGGPGDHFNPQNAERLSIGLALGH